MSAAADERLPFGRALVDGAPRFCLLDGDTLRLLDRPAYEPGAREVGRAAAAEARVLAPVLPTKIVAVGLNYRAHAAELAMPTHAEPILFLKPPSALVGPHDAVAMPAASSQVDYEAELALVVGRRCRAAGTADAASFVAGYTCANDVTARDLQKVDGQWTRGKSFDTFCPWVPGWCATRRRPAPPSRRRSTASWCSGGEWAR